MKQAILFCLISFYERIVFKCTVFFRKEICFPAWCTNLSSITRRLVRHGKHRFVSCGFKIKQKTIRQKRKNRQNFQDFAGFVRMVVHLQYFGYGIRNVIQIMGVQCRHADSSCTDDVDGIIFPQFFHLFRRQAGVGKHAILMDDEAEILTV